MVVKKHIYNSKYVREFGINLKEIARKLNVSQGSVSQMPAKVIKTCLKITGKKFKRKNAKA